MENSRGRTWEEAVNEWEIVDCLEEESRSQACICGKEELRYLYRIHNFVTDRELFPIGSSCIQKFERDDLQEEVSVSEGMFKLLHAVEQREYIELSSKLFSRKLLKALYDRGAFKPNEYNDYDGRNDYEFMLKMFNKRDKQSITNAQNRKVRAILLNSIKPYLQSELDGKTNC